jgi:hypothetical protein
MALPPLAPPAVSEIAGVGADKALPAANAPPADAAAPPLGPGARKGLLKAD